MDAFYIRNGVWGWPLERQTETLTSVTAADTASAVLYQDVLSAAHAKKPSHIQPEWLTRRAEMIRAMDGGAPCTIHVATLLALGASEADLIAVLTAADAMRAVVIAHDSHFEAHPGAGMQGAHAALEDWHRARRNAQSRPGRAAGNRAAAEKRRRQTLAKIKEARPLWRDTRPDRLTVEQISEKVGLSGKTLYAELRGRPAVTKR